MSNDIYAYLMQTNNHNRDTWEANGIGHLYPYGGKKDREETAVTSSPDLPEAAIQQQVIDLLVAAGWLVLRINSGGAVLGGEDNARFVRFVSWQCAGYGKEDSGVPDLVAFKNGSFLFLETKTATGRVRESQRRFAAAASSTGNEVAFVRSVEDVALFLENVEL